MLTLLLCTANLECTPSIKGLLARSVPQHPLQLLLGVALCICACAAAPVFLLAGLPQIVPATLAVSVPPVANRAAVAHDGIDKSCGTVRRAAKFPGCLYILYNIMQTLTMTAALYTRAHTHHIFLDCMSLQQ